MTVQAILLLTSVMTVWPGEAVAQETPDKDTTVTIAARKKAVKKALDKTVYSTTDNPKAESGTAQDVLQSTPTLSVTADGTIAVKGNTNVTVLVNGKPSAAMSGDARAVTLQTLTGSDIASIEVITNPSAAYNANGGAIVNIVLKKDRKPGAHGSVRGNASDQGLWNINAAGDYTKGKLSLHGSVSVRRDGTLKFRQSDVNWRDPATGHTGENWQSSEVFIRRIVQSATLGADYDLSDTDALNAAAGYNFRRSRPYFDEFHQDYTDNQLTDSYHRISKGPNQQSDDSFTLGYSHQDNDTLLKLSAQHSATINLVDKSYRNAFVYPISPTTFARISNKTARRLNQVTIDLAFPISPSHPVSMGLDYQTEANTIGNYLAALDPLNGTETIDPVNTHRYRVVTTQASAYVTTQIQKGPWNLLIGARYEGLTTRLETGTSTPDARTYSQSLNPSLTVKYTVSESDSLSLSYRQSLQRPDPSDLNPFTTYGDAQNRFTGNPALRPQSVRSLELSYDRDQEGLSRSFGAFYRQSRDTVVDVRTFTADNILLNSKANGGSGLSTGINGSFDWHVSADLHLNADGGLYYAELETTDLGQAVRQTGISGYANLSIGYHFGANDLSLDAHSNGSGLTPQGTYGATQSLNLSWKRRLTKRLTVTLSANDMLDGSKQTYTTTTTTFAQRGYNHFVAKRVYIGLVYRLN